MKVNSKNQIKKNRLLDRNPLKKKGGKIIIPDISGVRL